MCKSDICISQTLNQNSLIPQEMSTSVLLDAMILMNNQIGGVNVE